MLELDQLYNMDCMDGMREFPDKFFDLAIVDPPYGIGKTWKKNRRGIHYKNVGYNNSQIPDREYFCELKRVSVNQIIWGYNYFTEFLGPSGSLIFWDKHTVQNFYSGGELAYTSFSHPLKVYRHIWDGAKKGGETGIVTIHPHQKPIALYQWLLKTYAKPGDKILDTHTGSASSLVACHNAGFEYIGFELSEEYYNSALWRLYNAKLQCDLFNNKGLIGCQNK